MKAILLIIVVAGLLALLGAILFPAFAQAKSSAKKSSLESRLRQLETKLSMQEEYGAAAEADPSQPKLLNAGLLTERSVIRKAKMQVRVDDIAAADKKVQALVKSANGYLDSEEGSYLSSDAPSLTITMRIPEGSFEAIIASLEQLGELRSKAVNIDDVTEQIVDMDARLKTMVAQEETYRELLKGQRSVKAIIEVEDRLMSLRGEIESLAAQRKSLAGQASLSTVEVELVRESSIEAVAASDPNWLKQAWTQAWSAGIAAFRGLTVVLIWALVFSPVWIAATVAYRLMRRPRPVTVASARIEGA